MNLYTSICSRVSVEQFLFRPIAATIAKAIPRATLLSTSLETHVVKPQPESGPVLGPEGSI